ncbi:hypothetical protein STVIR_1364 [Streptomyces viridochromogenes Tue57]|uniref:Uncharacterized protein n=1 Tax=Streptomyces viridochromogenes Tue57 TaxID=1160705 RepID=L8PJD2_STRVR|nr:hypothetical protein STVIR_1364 [Streptomyces viridochromogenes Tue57]
MRKLVSAYWKIAAVCRGLSRGVGPEEEGAARTSARALG